MEEKRYVAFPKTLTDRRTVVTAKIDVEDGCGDLDAVQGRDRFTCRLVETTRAPAAFSMSAKSRQTRGSSSTTSIE
jgi:hypothetical protein